MRDIEYFAVVAEHGHLSRAADALDLGQPALSKSLRRLEQAAGARLFARTSKGVELTPAGAALLSRVRRLRLAVDDVAQELADIGRGHAGHLRIGALAGFMEFPISEVARTMMQETPDVTLNVTVATVDALLPALQKGELDLTVTPITAPPNESIVQEHLFDDEFVVIASTNHRLARAQACDHCRPRHRAVDSFDGERDLAAKIVPRVRRCRPADAPRHHEDALAAPAGHSRLVHRLPGLQLDAGRAQRHAACPLRGIPHQGTGVDDAGSGSLTAARPTFHRSRGGSSRY